MNWELIGWIAVGIIIWELIYILLRINKLSYFWVTDKMISLAFTSVFMLFQAIFVFGTDWSPGLGEGNYINLLWELLIVGAIVIFFYLNKKLNNWIESKDEE